MNYFKSKKVHIANLMGGYMHHIIEKYVLVHIANALHR